MIIRPYKSFFSARNLIPAILLVYVVFFISACTGNSDKLEVIHRKADIFPGYYDLTLPVNIAPLNFIINEPGSRFKVEIKGQNGNSIVMSERSPKIKIPLRKWHKLLTDNAGTNITVDISAFTNGTWKKYNQIKHFVSEHPIDSVLVYRLVYATHLKWDKMGIYQRELSNFRETPIIENHSTGNGCMNCHTFSDNNPNTMAIHFRIVNPGTLVWSNGKLQKIQTKIDGNMSAGVYPSWHPNGKHIAFATGKISPHLTTRSKLPLDVADKASGIFVYNTENHNSYTSPEISTNRRESMPEWSADGNHLYFISAPEAVKGDAESLLRSRYSLMRIAFDAESGTWGSSELLLNADSLKLSFSMPNASPNGRFLVCSASDFGYFTILNQESDLYLFDTNLKSCKKMELNSDFAESFSTWSSNSRWLVFSSKRTDGVYTFPYISHIDSAGNAGTPFLLPQKDPEIYTVLQANFNRPELVKGKIKLKPAEIRDLVTGDAVKSQ